MSISPLNSATAAATHSAASSSSAISSSSSSSTSPSLSSSSLSTLAQPVKRGRNMDDAIAAMRQYVQKYKSTEFHQMVGADLGKIAEKIAEQHGVNHYALMNACGFSR